MAQTLVNGTAKTNTINAKELYSSEAGTCEAAREPASKGRAIPPCRKTPQRASRGLLWRFSIPLETEAPCERANDSFFDRGR